MGHRLLILSCSQRKRSDAGLMPAIERYDGPAFRVLRKYLRTSPVDPPFVFVLSARFGLIPIEKIIPAYDQRMTQQRARELRSSVCAALHSIAAKVQPIDSAHFHLGRDYLEAIDGWSKILSAAIASFGDGTQGVKLGRLRTWLYGDELPRVERSTNLVPRHPIRLRGVALNFSADEALEVVRMALGNAPHSAFRYHAWFVEIDEARVAPKWLVSTLTGLPVSQFVTTEAIRVLSQLGIDVRHT